MVDDPRSRIKVYLDTWLLNANLTKDNGSTQVLFKVMYANPDYPLILEFKGSNNLDLVYCVGTPDSTALPVSVGYIENMPVTIWCIDKTGITGTELRWKAEAEFRRVVETKPTGSLYNYERLGDNEKNLGSTILYSVKYVLRYKRYA
jgi:hypothetical protein